MRSLFSNLAAILDRRERLKALVVFGLMLAAAAADMLGVAVVMPFVQLAMKPDRIAEMPLLSDLQALLNIESTSAFVLIAGFAVLAVLIGSLLMRAFSMWAQLRYAAGRKHHIASRLLARYLRQPYEWYLTRHSSEISTSVLNESTQAVDFTLFPAMQVLADGLVVVLLVSLLLLIDPVLAFGAAVVLGGGYFLVFSTLRSVSLRAGRLRQSAQRERFRVVQESFGGFKDVKLRSFEDRYLARFLRPSTQLAFAEARSRVLAETPRFAMQGIVFVAMILAVLYNLASKGTLDESIPSLAGFAFAGFRLLPAMQSVYAQATALKIGLPVLQAVVDELGDAESVSIRPSVSEPGPQRLTPESRIALRNVKFHYPATERPALDGVSMTIEARTTVGIVGTTGSGKTTLLDVMLGLLVPSAGVLEIDGVAVDARNRRAWQQGVGYVPQQIYLSDETVAANIAFGRVGDEIDHDAVIRASRIANLHEFVIKQLPDGYDTIVGERGIRLSGGQRQRIGIARALYTDPPVLMLDEATSALDNVTEQAVMEAIDRLEGEKTIVLIAHRLSTVRRCDRIFVMDAGRCVDAGSWDELVARNAEFREMAQLSA